MTFDVFGYNFPHFKTNNGLVNLCAHGFKPSRVILQDKKKLSVPSSNYRITPIGKEVTEPAQICNMLNIPFYVCDHNDFKNTMGSDFAVILGARILSKELIERYRGIINLHPGILPGNRGLDNVKWSIIKKLPIGVTAHWIDGRIDMGRKIAESYLDIYPDDTIRDVYIRQRQLEQELLLLVFMNKWYLKEGEEIEHTPKFSAVPDELDNNIEHYWNDYKKNMTNDVLKYVGASVIDEMGNSTKIKEAIHDGWNPELGDVYIFLCETGYYADMTTIKKQ